MIVVVLFFALVRWHLRSLPLERDEGEYAYSGQLILEGIPPYKLAYNMKWPGTYAAYAVIMAVFGESPSGIRIGILLVNAATTILVFLLAKRLHGLITGVVAGSTYALLSTRSSVLGFQGHATHFVALAAIAGILLLLWAIESERVSMFFLSGLFFGLGILMKQHGIFLALFGGLYAWWKLASGKHEARGVGRIALQGVMFSAGVALPFAVTCLILYRAGVFREFWFWTFSYGRAYASEMSLGEGWKMIRAVGPWMLHPVIISEIAGIGLTALSWSKKVRSQAVFTVGFLIFSLFSVIPGYYFRPHYFILLLPAASLWTGIGVAAPQEWLQQRQSQRWIVAMPLVIFVLAFVISVRGQRKFFLGEDPQLALHDSRGCGDGCAENTEIAEYLKSNSTPQDQVAVLGSEPAIYFYSRRHSATGYIYMYGLTEKQKYAEQMRHDMVAEVKNARPAIIVYVDNAGSWWNLGSTKEVAYLEPLEEWIHSQYHLEKQIPIAGSAQHQWGDHAAFYIFRRNH